MTFDPSGDPERRKNNGWLKRQMASAKRDYEQLPAWLRQDEEDKKMVSEIPAEIASELERAKEEIARLQQRLDRLEKFVNAMAVQLVK